MRYSFVYQPHFTKRPGNELQLAACLYQDSFLVEDTSTELYDYSKDSTICQFVLKDLRYYCNEDREEALRRLEDTLVVSYKPELNEFYALGPVSRTLRKQFKELEQEYNWFKTIISNDWRRSSHNNPAYLFENLFEPADSLSFRRNNNLEDQLNIIHKRLSQLAIENRRFQVLNRYYLLHEKEKKTKRDYDKDLIYHRTERNNDTPVGATVQQYFRETQLHPLDSFPTGFPLIPWPSTPRTGHWFLSLEPSAARDSIVRNRTSRQTYGGAWKLLYRRRTIVWALVHLETGQHLAYENWNGDIAWV